MSKLRCPCGHTIVDQRDNIPYKASYRKDKDLESYMSVADEIADFQKAIETGEREEWIKKYFSEDYLGIHPSNLEVIRDVISGWDFQYRGEMFQCEKCGRIAIEKDNSNVFSFFKPDDNDSNGIFDIS